MVLWDFYELSLYAEFSNHVVSRDAALGNRQETPIHTLNSFVLPIYAECVWFLSLREDT